MSKLKSRRTAKSDTDPDSDGNVSVGYGAALCTFLPVNPDPNIPQGLHAVK